MSLTNGQKAIIENILVGSGDRDNLNALVKALTGDMKFSVLPTSATVAYTSAGWTKDVVILLTTADGEVHTWFQNKITISIADTSTSGTASIATTTLSMVDGRGIVTITGDAAAWLEAETATLTIEADTILGYTVASKTFVVTIS